MSTTTSDDYYDLGTYHRPITTNSPEAQKWFDRGLIWSYGFHHEESADCFQKAISLDPDCAMAYWGLAYALGPNYNKPWSFFDGVELESTVSRTHAAIESALSKSKHTTAVEQALINALEFRYPQGKPASDCSIWNAPYADAMSAVHAQFPDDLEVATLCADALMNLTPWALWDLRTGQPSPDAKTLEVKRILDHALALPGGSTHPGLLHLYIHLMEMSPTPERAMSYADNLRNLVPDSGHLRHMPSHLDILCGDYRAAIASNSAAMVADKKYTARAGPLHFYTLYVTHDAHFRLYAALFSAQKQTALLTAQAIEDNLPESLLRVPSPPMADWLESFVGMRVHVLVRFGLWDDLLALPLPADQDLYCVTTALVHYGKGIAYASLSRTSEATAQQELFLSAAARVKPTRTLFNNTATDILAVARAMLAGEIAYREARFDEAYAHLRRAVELDDSLPYDEPWGWMQPPRHAYGALLLEQGRVADAAQVYAADLGFDDSLPRPQRHPNNVWALHGYHECLVKLGRRPEANILRQQLMYHVALADVEIKSSCFCRLNTDDAIA
ncbi:hypothetical protein PV08_01422 [Exophiala spinifera]|uniref:TPR domain protein n=1 Tax=Exophiala spinifera TaxID=91928 RepID=A0A0D2CBB7_9EURO|nr:uncharacterized protein PV08_01422 [Exophiala spinifera]KIW20844.1 hypothetical protein PV08_01422 [Exophiala spinifera]